MSDIKRITDGIKTLTTKVNGIYAHEYDMNKIEKTIKSALRVFLKEVASSRIFTNGEIRALMKEESLKGMQNKYTTVDEWLSGDVQYEQFMKLLNK